MRRVDDDGLHLWMQSSRAAASVSGSRSPSPPRRSLSPGPRVAPLGMHARLGEELLGAGNSPAGNSPAGSSRLVGPPVASSPHSGPGRSVSAEEPRFSASRSSARHSTAVLMPTARVGERASSSGLALRFGSSDISTSDAAWGSKSPCVASNRTSSGTKGPGPANVDKPEGSSSTYDAQRVWLHMHRGQHNPDSTEWELADKMLRKVFEAEQLAPELVEAQRDLKLARAQLTHDETDRQRALEECRRELRLTEEQRDHREVERNDALRQNRKLQSEIEQLQQENAQLKHDGKNGRDVAKAEMSRLRSELLESQAQIDSCAHGAAASLKEALGAVKKTHED
eukprot:COSAG02_NODE_5936_length_3930_cov_52.777865_1_plen_340_part_00